MTDCSISKSLLDPSSRFPKKLCASVPLCFPGPKTPGDWKHRDTEDTESLCEGCVDKPNTASMTDCSISKSLLDPSSRFPKNSVSLCLCVSNLCFKFPSPTQVSWQTFCHASNLAHPNNFHNENGTTWALRFSPKLQKIQFQKIHNVFNPNTLDLIVNDAWIESTSFTSAKSLKIRELPIAKTGFSGSGSGFAVCERDLSNAACCRCCVETLS